MKLYNTLTQRIEPFLPQGETVTLYVCGITPYDTTHLGHAFTYTSVDILVRYLEYLGLTVRYVQNVTDVDDDILRRAGQTGDNWKWLGNHWTTHFIRDMQALSVRPPNYFPRATDVIPDIVAAVKKLLDAGLAYESGGNLYYDITRFPDFGKLSRLGRTKMLSTANERGNNPSDPLKRRPLDFVLWQAQQPGEPAWDSPWGSGRPGWHIECSTMASLLLGETIDIHAGGEDLAFPHHESEIAQVEPINGQKPFVRFWMHTAMVRHQGEKMSKSLGNLLMVRDLLKTWTPDALRLYLASHHYRKPWSHDEKDLQRAEDLSRRLLLALSNAGGSGATLDSFQMETQFGEAMNNDLDTPAALTLVEGFAEEIISAARAGRNVGPAHRSLRTMGRVFGLRLDAREPEERVIEGWDLHQTRFSEGREVLERRGGLEKI